MAGKVSYEKLTQKNISGYSDFISDVDELSGSDETGIGIKEDGVPFGVVILGKTKNTLVVESVRVKDPEVNRIGTEIFKGLNMIAKSKGYKTIGYRFADDEPFVNEDFLRQAGFTEFDREATVYNIRAFELGRFLRESETAKEMLKECERIIRVKKARSLSLVPQKDSAFFKDLEPDDEHSYVTVDKKGNIESYVIISQYPDMGFFLADMYSANGREDDLRGLLYMALGSVFMSIEPDGVFYIAAVNGRIQKIVSRLFSPETNGIYSQEIVYATRTVGKSNA